MYLTPEFLFLQLYMAQDETSLESTRKMLLRLIFQSVETASVTAVTMLLCLFCFEFATSSSAALFWCVFILLSGEANFHV